MSEGAAPSTFAGDVRREVTLALRRWPLALALYLPGLLLAVVVTVPVFRGAEALGGLGPWSERVAEGDLLNASFDLTSAVEEALPELRAAIGGLAWGTLLLLLAIPLQGLLYNVLAGGVLDRLAGRSTGSFASACWHWAGPMIRIGIAGFVLFLFLAGVGTTVLALIPLPGVVAWWLKPLLAGLWLAVLNGMLETARASIVVRDDRSALAALGRALTLPARSGVFLPTLGLWVVLGLAGAALALVGGWVLGGVPAGLPLAILLAQQALAFAGALFKLLRLGAAVGVSRAAWPG